MNTLTTKELAEIFGISKKAVLQKINTGKLKATRDKLGGYHIDIESAKNYAEIMADIYAVKRDRWQDAHDYLNAD